MSPSVSAGFAVPSPAADPLELFESWWANAEGQVLPPREAVALATATRDGRPAVRMVLFRGLVDGRFRFYTSYRSRKARDLDENPRAALCFHWAEYERQIRVEGTVEKLSAAASDDYFASRPRGSQLSAAISPQSEIVESKRALEAERDELERRLDGAPVPRPDWWGGYGLVPERIELWVSGGDRLHDRFLYEREGTGWRFSLLAP